MWTYIFPIFPTLKSGVVLGSISLLTMTPGSQLWHMKIPYRWRVIAGKIIYKLHPWYVYVIIYSPLIGSYGGFLECGYSNLSWKINMDDDWGTPILGNLHMYVIATIDSHE